MESLLVLFLAIPLMACGGGDLKSPVRKARVSVGGLQSNHASAFKPTLKLSPKAVTLAPGATQSFSAQINYEPDGPRFPRQPVTWTVLEAGGGVITPAGLYTAPLSTGTYHLKAEREDHPGIAGTAMVTVVAKSTPKQ